jgi:miniconductance mechanosensitive channel
MHTLKDPAIWLKNIFIDAGLGYSFATFLSTITLVAIVLLLSWLSNVIAKTIINKVVTRIVLKSKSQWDDVFLEQKVFSRMSHFAPALVIHFMSGWALKDSLFWLSFVHNLNYIYMLSISMIVLLSFIESWHKIYETLPISRHRNIKGYVQLVKILVILITILLIVSVVFKKDISRIVAGLGAMAAVIILVFKDTLLGFVGSIQLSANKMLKVGDWITMDNRGVDGVVTDISLNTIKVQNFDKTIITIPTYAMVAESFQNWTGMEESGVRQIKRAIFIDMKSIRFLDKELKARLSVIPTLKNHIEITETDSGRITAKEDPFLNPHRLTNLGLFRYYAEEYLRNHPLIDKNNATIVRHRAPEGNGLPLQVFTYASRTTFVPFENIQSEVFEHILAMLKEFDLRVYQQPTGEDLLQLADSKRVLKS